MDHAPEVRTSLLNFRNLGPTAPSTPSYPSRSFAGAPTMPVICSSALRAMPCRALLIPISTVSPFISPSIVSFNVNNAICTASSSSRSSLYLFSRKVFALVALLPMAVAFHGKSKDSFFQHFPFCENNDLCKSLGVGKSHDIRSCICEESRGL